MAKKDDKQDEDNGWGDTTGRYPLDALLRECGFKIHARPGGGKEARWKKDGDVYPESAALRLLDPVEVAKARNCIY